MNQRDNSYYIEKSEEGITIDIIMRPAILALSLATTEAFLGQPAAIPKCEGISFYNSKNATLNQDLFDTHYYAQSMYYNNGSPAKPQGSFYLKCDHPEGVDAKWTTCPWVVIETWYDLSPDGPSHYYGPSIDTTVARCSNCNDKTDKFNEVDWVNAKWEILDRATNSFVPDDAAKVTCCTLKKTKCMDCNESICNSLKWGMCGIANKVTGDCCVAGSDPIIGLPTCSCKSYERICDHSKSTFA